MSKKGITNKLKVLKGLLDDTFVKSDAQPADPRFEIVKAAVDNLPTVGEQEAYIDDAIEQLEQLKTKLNAKKGKARFDFLSAGIPGLDDDDEDGKAGDATTNPAKSTGGDTTKTLGKTLLENRQDAHKRLCAQKYALALGGQGKWRVDPHLCAFLNNASIPPLYKGHLTAMVNESPVTNRAFEILSSGQPIKDSDMKELGELVIAEAGAKALVLFAAHHKGVKEHFTWSEATLARELETETKVMVGIALRNASGSDLSLSVSSFGDIFNIKEEVEEDRGGERKRHRDESTTVKSSGSAEWYKTKPAGIKSNDRCSVCNGWGHRGGCLATPPFDGYCSVCHGKGHKKMSCPSA